jgi:hypothetical protein
MLRNGLIISGVLACLLVASCSDVRSTTVSFGIADAPAGTVRARGDIGDVPDAVLVLELTDEEPQIEVFSVTAGTNSITVLKDSVFLLGFISYPELPGEPVQFLGNLHVAEANVDLLPLDDDAQDEIYLGELTFDGTTFSSNMTLTELADGTGESVDVLRAYGLVDQTLLRFLNPDVNQNGTLDVEELFQWSLNADFSITFDHEVMFGTEYGSPVDVEDFETGSVRMYWRTSDPVDAETWDEIWMVLPTDIDISRDGVPVTQAVNYEFAAGIPAQDGVFNFDTGEGDWSPQPPYDGDYQIVIGSRSYTVLSVNFAAPESGFYGIPLPACRVYHNAAGDITRAEVRYFVVQDGVFTEPTPEQLQTILRSVTLDFGTDLESDVPDVGIELPYDGAQVEVDLTPYALNRNDVNAFPIVMRDLAGYQYQPWTTSPTAYYVLE